MVLEQNRANGQVQLQCYSLEEINPNKQPLLHRGTLALSSIASCQFIFPFATFSCVIFDLWFAQSILQNLKFPCYYKKELRGKLAYFYLSFKLSSCFILWLLCAHLSNSWGQNHVSCIGAPHNARQETQTEEVTSIICSTPSALKKESDTKIISKRPKDLKVRADIIKLLEENISKLHDIRFGNDFLTMTPKVQVT